MKNRTLAPLTLSTSLPLLVFLLMGCSTTQTYRRAPYRCFVIDRYIGTTTEEARRAALKNEPAPADVDAMIREIVRLDTEVQGD